MKIKGFKLERYFAQHEFTVQHLLSCSDCDGLPMQQILEQASEQECIYIRLGFGRENMAAGLQRLGEYLSTYSAT